MHTNDWATALDKFWGDLEPGSRALLMLERSLLPYIAELAGGEFEVVEDAENDFLQVVNAYLRGKASGPWYPEPFCTDRPPRFLLQIAVQVYAASKMADAPDGHHTMAAYYVQLENLVGNCGARERFNLNDQGEYHQRLWRERLAEWAKARQLWLDLPEDHSGAGRHVQLPKSQAALRVGDIERLPVFFHKCRFEPMGSDEVMVEGQIETIGEQLRRRKHDFDCFSSWAQRVLDDRLKFPMAVVQVEQAFREWDGRLVLRNAGRRSQRPEKERRWIWLVVQTGLARLKAVGGETLASARKIDTVDLAEIFSGKTVGDDRLEMQEGLGLFRYDEEDAAFKDASYVDAGDRGLLVFGPRFKGNTKALFSAESIYHSPRLYAVEEVEHCEILDGIPEGCLLFEFRVADRLPPVDSIPELWRSFLRLPPAGLSLSGGLRIGHKEQFVAGAGPQLKISGNRLPTFIRVDGERVDISSRTVRLDQFSTPGKHEIAACFDGKCLEKCFEVLHPKLALPVELPTCGWAFAANDWPTWETSFARHDGNQETTPESSPALFGVRGQGLQASDVEQLSNADERLIAIQLLAGMPLPGHPNTRTKHPLVRHLLNQQLQSQRS